MDIDLDYATEEDLDFIYQNMRVMDKKEANACGLFEDNFAKDLMETATESFVIHRNGIPLCTYGCAEFARTIHFYFLGTDKLRVRDWIITTKFGQKYIRSVLQMAKVKRGFVRVHTENEVAKGWLHRMDFRDTGHGNHTPHGVLEFWEIH